LFRERGLGKRYITDHNVARSMWRPLDVEEWVESRRADLEGVRSTVSAIVDHISQNGDAALMELTKKFDKIDIKRLAIARERIDDAYEQVDPELVEALEEAAFNITRFHELQRQNDLWLKEVEPGVTVGVKRTPLRRVGAYVPGGRAAYPSTALMCAIPAKVAGVEEVICCTPPPVKPMTLVAMDIAGVDEIYQIGGAQAIAAMALGTESIESVQKIVGPGNVFVTVAKMLLRDHADIDFPAGPSEIAIIADRSANAEFVAADILAQAEHDPHAGCVLITDSPELADEVGAFVVERLTSSPRKEIIESALANSGYVLVESIAEAISASDVIAPEHLSIQVSDPLQVMNKVRNAGSIFIGPYSAVACGDYASGTNHVLPTAGYARAYSGLSVDTFTKTSTVQIIDREGLDMLADAVIRIAEAEGLQAHADSVRIRRMSPPEL
jgi:histidinol dehydrogenase